MRVIKTKSNILFLAQKFQYIIWMYSWLFLHSPRPYWVSSNTNTSPNNISGGYIYRNSFQTFLILFCTRKLVHISTLWIKLFSGSPFFSSKISYNSTNLWYNLYSQNSLIGSKRSNLSFTSDSDEAHGAITTLRVFCEAHVAPSFSSSDLWDNEAMLVLIGIMLDFKLVVVLQLLNTRYTIRIKG